MTLATEQVLLYGLHIDSSLPLHQDRSAAPSDAPADVTIRVGEARAFTDLQPAGRMLLEFELDRRIYSATVREEGDGYILRCYRACDFEIDANLRDVTVHIVAGADPGLASVLATGTLLSFLLTLRGHVVLHASAVQVGAGALAFVGSTGMGKSTIATLMCADGAPLITDDVLRLDLSGAADASPTCHVGTSEVRLRKAAGHLTTLFDEPIATRRTADDRDALRLLGANTPRLPLAAIVIPMPDHGRDRTPKVERLSPKAALLALLRFPRLLGWQDTETLSRHFHQLGEVVERAPVYVARLPWGPPFPEGIAEGLRYAVGIDHSATTRGR
jgi:hypothetical protein